jgi:hypothetical protein
VSRKPREKAPARVHRDVAAELGRIAEGIRQCGNEEGARAVEEERDRRLDAAAVLDGTMGVVLPFRRPS